ncbi:hypothetical protein AAC03nite_07330 [Alicyclobacillus acidoterrestris]|nr:hypothetical protein AAC03nite_07330 [Alicyclobacillus acidoterrestris]
MKPGNHRKSDGANSCRTIVLGDKRDAVQKDISLWEMSFFINWAPPPRAQRVDLSQTILTAA